MSAFVPESCKSKRLLFPRTLDHGRNELVLEHEFLDGQREHVEDDENRQVLDPPVTQLLQQTWSVADAMC